MLPTTEDLNQQVALLQLEKPGTAIRRDFIRAQMTSPEWVSLEQFVEIPLPSRRNSREERQSELFFWANRSVPTTDWQIRVRRCLKYIQATYHSVAIRGRAIDILEELVLETPKPEDTRQRRPRITQVLDRAIWNAGSYGLSVEDLIGALGNAGHFPARPRSTVMTWARRAIDDRRIHSDDNGRFFIGAV